MIETFKIRPAGVRPGDVITYPGGNTVTVTGHPYADAEGGVAVPIDGGEIGRFSGAPITVTRTTEVPPESAALDHLYTLTTDADRIAYLATLPMSTLRRVADLLYVDQDSLSTRKTNAARAIVAAL